MLANIGAFLADPLLSPRHWHKGCCGTWKTSQLPAGERLYLDLRNLGRAAHLSVALTAIVALAEYSGLSKLGKNGRMPKRDLAAWIREDHEQVMRLADRLHEAIAMVPRICTWDWVRGTQARFDEFCSHVRRHIALEEREGYMNAILKRRPTLSGRIGRLEQEHRDLIRLLDELQILAQELAPERHLLVRDFCYRLRSFLGYVEHHEREENDLAEFVFTQDIGDKD